MKKDSFAKKHPVLNFLLGLILLMLLVLFAGMLVKWVIVVIIHIFNLVVEYLKKFVSNTDKVIVVAMITGTVSIISVLFSSVIAKIIDYKYNVKKYLYDKREEPYEQFIAMVYKILEDTKKEKNKMTEAEMTSMVSEFSKGLTLWGSNEVVKKWNKYRLEAVKMENAESLFLLEEIIYEIRKDVGQKKKMRKGDILSLFINDIDKYLKKNK